VKTRLAKDLGDLQACEIFKALASRTLAAIPNHWPIHVLFTPTDARSEMEDWLGKTLNFLPQAEGNLGQRLESASSTAFAEGASSVILLGGDCPGITTAHFYETAEKLSKKREVIGPATDGGYWLLGLTQHYPDIFHDIAWSSDAVFSATMNQFAILELSPHQLETLEDVDDFPAWKRAQNNYSNLKTIS